MSNKIDTFSDRIGNRWVKLHLKRVDNEHAVWEFCPVCGMLRAVTSFGYETVVKANQALSEFRHVRIKNLDKTKEREAVSTFLKSRL